MTQAKIEDYKIGGTEKIEMIVASFIVGFLVEKITNRSIILI